MMRKISHVRKSTQFLQRKARILKLDKALKKLFPVANIELNFSNPLELLVAVQLSAQCTDKMVNTITERLFKKYKTLEDYVHAGKTQKGINEFERDIFASGFYRNKTKNILGAAKMIKNEFGGIVPNTMAEILRLPGVARKTATVVLKEAHGVVAGITVDTHVIRFCSRFDLSDYKNPVKIENDLMAPRPRGGWGIFPHGFIPSGRSLAPARGYAPPTAPLKKISPPAAKRF